MNTNCPFCQGPTELEGEQDPWNSGAKDDPKFDSYHETRTCHKCRTPECYLEFNFLINKVPLKAELINYCLKYNGYTAWVGVKYPGTEITHDWHTTTRGTVQSSTMCYPILMSQEYSMSLTPENFPRRLKTVLVFQ